MKKNYTKTEQNITCSHKTSILDNSSRKQNSKKSLVSNSSLDVLFNDTTHISLRWIYRSAKIVWTKKNPFEYIVPPPTSGVGTVILTWSLIWSSCSPSSVDSISSIRSPSSGPIEVKIGHEEAEWESSDAKWHMEATSPITTKASKWRVVLYTSKHFKKYLRCWKHNYNTVAYSQLLLYGFFKLVYEINKFEFDKMLHCRSQWYSQFLILIVIASKIFLN